MTVKELREALKGLKPDTEVRVAQPCGISKQSFYIDKKKREI